MKTPTLLLCLVALTACKDNPPSAATPDDLVDRFYCGCAPDGEFLDVSELPDIPASFDEAVP